MESWDYAHCLPYFKRMETLPRRRRRVPAAATARSCSSAARRLTPLFGAFFEAVQQAGYPLTDDVNGYRQEGFARFDRNDPPRPPAERGAGLPPPGAWSRANLEGASAGRSSTASSSTARGPSASSTSHGRTVARARRTVTAGEVISAAAPSTRRSCSSSPASATPASSSARRPGRARPARRRREPPGPPRGLHPVRLHAAGVDAAGPASWRNRPWIGFQLAVLPRGAGRHQPLRGRRLRPRRTTTSPTRTSCSTSCRSRCATTARSPAGGHGYQVHVGPMYSDAAASVKITSHRPAQHPALRFNYLSTDAGPARVGGGRCGSARTILAQPAFDAVQRRRDCRPDRRSRPTRRSSTGWPATARPPCTRRARARWARVPSPCSTPRACRSTESTACAWSTPRRCPTSPTRNICASAMMLAEKAADLIAGNTPRPGGGGRLLPPRRPGAARRRLRTYRGMTQHGSRCVRLARRTATTIDGLPSEASRSQPSAAEDGDEESGGVDDGLQLAEICSRTVAPPTRPRPLRLPARPPKGRWLSQ